MAKPRIIIADTDVNYIIPLQLKLAQQARGVLPASRMASERV